MSIVARLAELEAQVFAAGAAPVIRTRESDEAWSSFGESVRGSIRDLIKLLLVNWENIDSGELEAIIAKLTEAGIALAGGAYIAAGIAAFAAWRLYRAAIKTPIPGPVV